MTRLITGAVAGTLATVPMTLFMENMHERLTGEPPRPLPPREVADALAVKAGVHRELSERDLQNLTLAVHFGYGALTGAVFGLMAPKNPAAAVGAGALFGLGVWAVSYLGWLPALGVRQPPKYDPPTRTRLMIASHVVWGVATGLMSRNGRK
jgi:uncharacterized membrane protein YagU involved in acid resistance